MIIGIIGLGYVGLTLSNFACKKYRVIGFDNNEDKISSLNRYVSYVEGISGSDLESNISSGNFTPTLDAAQLRLCDVIVIAVPTPLDENKNPDLAFLEEACKIIAREITSPALIITESTSYPGTLRNFIKPCIEKYQIQYVKHEYAVSPERVDPGRKDFDQTNTPRIIGALSDNALREASKFYSSFCNQIHEVTTAEVAECAKLFENSFRQVNIALSNQIAQYTKKLGISFFEVLDAAQTKPYGFMAFTPGAGVGGHCIPVDPTYLASAAEALGVQSSLIRDANRINIEMSEYIVRIVESENGGNLRNKRVQIVGVSYKANIRDVRETPAELIYSHLTSRGSIVTWHDDIVKTWRGETSSKLGNADIIIIVTRHAYLNNQQVIESAPYVFDCTGLVSGATTL